MTHKLDNPIWHCLSETHKAYAIDYGDTKFYHPDYCPFGGFIGKEGIADAIDQYASLSNDFFIIGNRPEDPKTIPFSNELICNQMIIYNRIETEYKNDFVKLTKSHDQALFNIVNLVQPGYFRIKTGELGDYYGIFDGDQLVAVTGERMRMNDYIEVSAVVTLPEHQGKGYASQLTAFVVNKIFDKGKTPFLHVAATNINAIRLYRKLGFELRSEISLWHYQKN